MSSASKKRMLWGLLALTALLVGCIVLYSIFSSNYAKQQEKVSVYLDDFEARAVAYLSQNEEFVADYGSESNLQAYSWSYGYTDPSKYPTFSFRLHYPLTLEEFEAELDHLTVSFALSDGRACTVSFKRAGDKGVDISGWSYIDEESET